MENFSLFKLFAPKPIKKIFEEEKMPTPQIKDVKSHTPSIATVRKEFVANFFERHEKFNSNK